MGRRLAFGWVAMMVFAGVARGAGMQRVHSDVAGIVAGLKPVGRLEGTKRLRLAISLPLRDRGALDAYVRDLYTPGSGNYRRFLGAGEFAQRFGPDSGEYGSVLVFARAHNLVVTGTHSNRTIVDVEGDVTDIEKTFHLKMQVYRHPTENRVFYAADREPTVELGVNLLRVSGLDDYAAPRPNYKINAKGHGTNLGSGVGGTYAGDDFRAAYAPGTGLTGYGQTVGLLEFDGYTTDDITYYEQRAGLPNVPLTNVLLDGYGGAPTGDGGEVEVSLDIEVAISMAPGMSNLLVYEAGPSGVWHDILNRMATDDVAKQMSCSWYIPDGPEDPVADQIFEQMAAQGQSFFSASGDSCAYTGLIPFPGDTPYITEVGGTTLTTSGPGGEWEAETVWNWGDGVGSSGGISTQYAIPSWQQGIAMGASQGSTIMRNTPDVAMTADNVYVRVDGEDEDVGGTSCAAPLWAGFTALVNQQAAAKGSTVGFLNPALYALAQGPNYASEFRDIVTGNNFSPGSPTRFAAETGYDLCTGLGTPAGTPLINALAGPPDPLGVTAATFATSGPSGGPFLPNTQTYTLSNNGTSTLEWTASTTAGWVTLSATSGTLAIGGSTTVIASVNATAKSLAAGSYSGEISFGDVGTGASEVMAAGLNVLPEVPVLSVTPTTGFTMTGPPGGAFNPSSVTYTVSNAGEAPMSWAVSSTAPWLTLSPAGGTLAAGGSTTVTAAYTAVADSLAQGIYTANVAFSNLSNSIGNVAAPATLVAIPAPVITSATTAITYEGRTFSYTITASNNPTAYRADGLPAELSLNAATGLISGITTQPGTTDVNIQAINAGGAGSAILEIEVAAAAPSISSTLAVTGTVGAAFNYQIAATNGPTGYNSSALPAGLTLNRATGLISGTATAAGMTNVTIFASNGVGTGAAELTLIFVPMPPPVIMNPVVILHSFGGADGEIPEAGVAQGTDGNLYGTTIYGGSDDVGTVFMATLSGSFATVASFDETDGLYPQGAVVEGTNGELYGTTLEGGDDYAGSLYEVTTSGSVANLYSFDLDDGYEPMGALIQAKDHNFYGVTNSGGTDFEGTIFQLTTSGTVNTILSFDYTNGDAPDAGLVQGTDSNLYGTTSSGGTDGDGTVFKCTTGGTLTTLVNFNGTNGNDPDAPLVQGTDSSFYGTTYSGGTAGDGNVFKMTSGGTLTNLVTFTGSNGENPEAGLYQGNDGNYYGTTYGGGPGGFGTVFRMTSSGSMTIICAFDGPNGENPEGGVIQASDGFYYGTTSGIENGYGTVFKVGSFIASGIVGTPFSYQITASHNPTSYTAVNLPPGLGYNAATGLISGTPTTAGTNSVTLGATNAGGTASGTVVFTIVLPQKPVITSALAATAAQGAFFSYQIAASVSPVSFGVGTLPAGLSFNQGTDVISGIPTVAGTTSVPLSASNAAGSGTAALVITVAPEAPVIITQPTTLYSFGTPGGSNPAAGVIQASDGNLYGTTESTGTSGDGAVFQVTTGGTFNTIASLSWGAGGAYPQGELIQANDGNLYGVAQSGGSSGEGTVFQVTLSGALAAIASFDYTNGAEPMGGVTQGSDGNLYGTTEGGGTNGDGTVFQMALSGSMTTLCSFSGTNGAEPVAGVVEGLDGNYYGTTLYGGSSNLGTVFQVTTSGSLTMLCSFSGTNGSEPMAGLVEGSDGSYYGTTLYGGSNNAGTVFKVTSSGTLTTLCSFDSADGANPPGGLALGGDGNFYGTTEAGGASNLGTLFEVTPGGDLTALYSFTGSLDGGGPQAGLTQGGDGNLYGTTVIGGANGTGTVFGVEPLYISGTSGQALSYQINATNSPTSYNATGLPEGFTIDGTTGLISGTAGAPGTSDVTISAANASGTGNATLVVSVLPTAPMIPGGLIATATDGEAFEYQIPALNEATSYGATGLPAGLSVSATSGIISGTPAVSGSFSATVTASNASGSGSGTLTFEVFPPAPSVATGIASGVIYDGATLNGTVNPNGLQTVAYFELGTSTSYGATTAAVAEGSGTASVGIATEVSGLLPLTTYHYRLDGTNSSGISFGSDQIFTTVGLPPSVTTNAASNVTYDGATLNASVNSNGLPTTLYFAYGPTTAYGSNTTAKSVGKEPAPAPESTTVTGLGADTVYHYQAVAINSSGTSMGMDQTLTTEDPPPTVLSSPATAIVYNGATLNGSVTPNGTDCTTYYRWGTTTSYGNTTAAQDGGSGSLPVEITAGLTGLNPNTSYDFQLVGVNTTGTFFGANERFTTAAPPPTAITGPANLVGYVTATVGASVIPNGLATTAYFVYGTTTSYGSVTGSQPLGAGKSAVAMSGSLKGLTAATLYHYAIVAINSSGTSTGLDGTFTTLDGEPVAVDEEVYSAGAKSVNIDVLASDSDPSGEPLKVTAASQGSYGTTVINADSTVTYTPGAKFKTSDTFSYTISDPFGATATGKVAVENGFEFGAGTYTTLISGTAPLNQNSGLLTVTTGPLGGYTGTLTFAGISYPLAGVLDGDFSGRVEIARPQRTELAMTFQLDPASNTIEGQITSGSNGSEFVAMPRSYSATNPAPQKGATYNALITLTPGVTGTNVPHGHGYLSIQVYPGGAVTAAGKLGDGASVSTTGLIVSGTICPLYFKVYGPTYPYAGSIFGELTLPLPGFSTVCSGTFLWFKPAQATAQAYQQGFAVAVAVGGSILAPPVTGKAAESRSVEDNEVFTAEGGGLGSPFSEAVTLGRDDVITPLVSGSSGLRVTISRETGLLRGSFVPPGGKGPVALFGIVDQGDDLGGGLFLTGSGSGGFTIGAGE